MQQEKIRNFCIIAHIDHGKSTLADRLLEITNTVDKRFLTSQILDSMELEKEKGITIKLKAVRMRYEDYELNLIDTPGHVDFTYEVSRSLAACEGAVLIVDATQGIQAQTISNVYKAMEADLTIIPVINKVDLPNAEIEKVEKDMEKTFGFGKEEILRISAKTGYGVYELLQKIIEVIPSPKGSPHKPTRGLIFDSYYDEHLGVVALIKVVDGKFEQSDINAKRKIKFLATNAQSEPQEIGILKIQKEKATKLETGQVGYIATGLKDIHKVKVGDTISWADENALPLPGYKEVKPFVFLSFYTIDNSKYPQLREALEKLSLSDSALSFEPESSTALGFGFKCGFLGLLHAEIIQERLEREYKLEIISTTPGVEYKITLQNNDVVFIKSAAQFPDPNKIKIVEEPWILTRIVSPSPFTGNIINLCQNRRALMRKMEYPTEDRVFFELEMPLSEMINNFFDDLKTATSGFASIDYEFLGYKEADVVKMEIFVHGLAVPALSQIVLRERSRSLAVNFLNKLKNIIPRQQFEVSLQAAIGGKIIARENIPALRKNVLAKMSGGHRERKDKLLEIQKRGKERLKRIGKVDIPQEAFRQILT